MKDKLVCFFMLFLIGGAVNAQAIHAKHINYGCLAPYESKPQTGLGLRRESCSAFGTTVYRREPGLKVPSPKKQIAGRQTAYPQKK